MGTLSKHKINNWKATFDLLKLAKEPCWKRLTRSKKTISWLKKDPDRVYTDECQHAKELWREAYFTAINAGENPSTKPKSSPKEERSQTPPDMERKKDVEQWQAT